MRLGATVILFCLSALSATAQPIDWQAYDDPDFGYRIELPLGLYAATGAAANGRQTFLEPGGGQLTIFAAPNEGGRDVRAIADAAAASGLIERLTYERIEPRWFVLSGFADAEDGTELIVYTKFLFSPDRGAFSAFEISYPAAESSRYDPIVTRIEKSLRAPAS